MINYKLKWIAQLSYLALILYIPIWLYFRPNPFSPFWSLLFWWFPLLAPLYGIIKGKHYSMTWANFLLIIPFSHGWTILLTSPEGGRWAMVELLLTCTYYVTFLMLASQMKKTAIQDRVIQSKES